MDSFCLGWEKASFFLKMYFSSFKTSVSAVLFIACTLFSVFTPEKENDIPPSTYENNIYSISTPPTFVNFHELHEEPSLSSDLKECEEKADFLFKEKEKIKKLETEIQTEQLKLQEFRETLQKKAIELQEKEQELRNREIQILKKLNETEGEISSDTNFSLFFLFYDYFFPLFNFCTIFWVLYQKLFPSQKKKEIANDEKSNKQKKEHKKTCFKKLEVHTKTLLNVLNETEREFKLLQKLVTEKDNQIQILQTRLGQTEISLNEDSRKEDGKNFEREMENSPGIDSSQEEAGVKESKTSK